MSNIKLRAVKDTRKRFIVYCEGDTEYNYINGMRTQQGVEIALQPVNMDGGGYKNYLDKIRKASDSNCIAKFAIIDSDKAVADVNEFEQLKSLINYCEIQNKKNDIPIFLILCQPDFEYVACMHCNNYKNTDTKTYIEKFFGYKDLDKFKSEKKVYQVLNSGSCSVENAFRKNVLMNCVIKNKYNVNRKSYKIKISQTNVEFDNLNKRATNLIELFDVIDWK